MCSPFLDQLGCLNLSGNHSATAAAHQHCDATETRAKQPYRSGEGSSKQIGTYENLGQVIRRDISQRQMLPTSAAQDRIYRVSAAVGSHRLPKL